MRRSKTSLPASLTLSYQQFRVRQTTKKIMPSGSYYKQTPGQLTPIWMEELWDICDSLSQMHITPWYPLDNTNSPWAGTGKHRRNCGANKCSQTQLGRSCPHLPYFHLCPTGTKKTDHHCFLAHVFRCSKRRHGRFCKHHSSVNAGPPLHGLWQHHCCGFGKQL
jgi:hypothetical protein